MNARRSALDRRQHLWGTARPISAMISAARPISANISANISAARAWSSSCASYPHDRSHRSTSVAISFAATSGLDAGMNKQPERRSATNDWRRVACAEHHHHHVMT